ncbi:ubiquitin carboxyl-terminal hydrolase 4 [Monosporozyma unispora]
MTNHDNPYYCRPVSRLSEVAEQFIMDDTNNDQQMMTKHSSLPQQKDLKYYLNQSIHILSNYKDQCKLLKDKYSDVLETAQTNPNAPRLDKEVLTILESSYIYYKIIHTIMSAKIPNLKEFKNVVGSKSSSGNGKNEPMNKNDKELLSIYNDLFYTLVNDENILQIKSLLKKYSLPPSEKSKDIPPPPPPKRNSMNPSLPKYPQLPKSGSTITCPVLMGALFKEYDPNDFLFIDVRPKIIYATCHIDTPNIICLEPVSFKEIYSDYELEKNSMITSTNEDIGLFNKRNTFKFIILYCIDEYNKKQQVLLNILLNKSFEKPLDNELTKVYILKGGLNEWIENGGKIIENKPVKQDEPISTIEENELPNPNATNSVYLDGDTSGLNLKALPKMVPSISHTMDKSMRDMMSSSSPLSPVSNAMMSSTSTMSSPLINGTSKLNDSFSLMSRQTSGGNNPQRTSSLKRLSQLLPSFKSIPSTSNLGNSSPRLSHLYSDSTSAVSLSTPPSVVSHNSGSNTTYTSYPDTRNLLQQTDLNVSANKQNDITSPSPPPLPKLPQNIMSTPQQAMGSPTSSINMSSNYHTRAYSSPAVSTPTISSPSLYSSALASRFLNSNNTSNNNNGTSVMTSKLQTETLHNQYNLDFIVGLENMGNSCYLNCIIQCLLGTHELTKIFLNNSYEKHINLNSKLGSKGVLAKNFARLVNTMYNHALTAGETATTRQAGASSTSSILSRKKSTKVIPVRPQQFRVAVGSVNSLFKDCSQQDCQEFCQFLLDGLHEDLNQNGGNPPLKELSKEAEEVREKLSLRIASSIEWERFLTTDFSVILDLFQGQYASRLTCKVCETTSTTYQPFSVLSIPIPHDKSKTACNIIDCFNEFTKIENLEVDEQWSCPHCKKKQPSTKKLTITRLPKNLIIHLKRFDNRLNKNNNLINYPFNLDLTEFWANDFDGRLPTGVTNELPTRGQIPPFNYKLYGVACHFGSLYGGHYTAYVDKGLGKGWYYFDDTNFRTIKNPNEPITSNAYVLFYKRIYGGV